MIELNDDEIILAVQAQKIIEERLTKTSYDPSNFVDNRSMMLWVAETFEEVAGLEVAVKMSEVDIPTSSGAVQKVFVPDITILGRVGAGEAIDKALKTESDWERKKYDAKNLTIEELDEITDGLGSSLID